MHRAIGDVERAALVPVEPLAIYDAEAFPLEEVDRLLAVGVLPGVPPDGNLGLEDIASHRCKAIRVAHHELDHGVLRRLNPWDVPVSRHVFCLAELML